MNQAQATVKFIRTGPRKLRLIADAVRGMEVEKALTSLAFVRKRASLPLSKALKQALANAKQIGLSSPLKISHLSIDRGPIYKRWRAVSRGQGHSIHKFTSHINVVVESERVGNVSQDHKITKSQKQEVKKLGKKVVSPAKAVDKKEKSEEKSLKAKVEVKKGVVEPKGKASQFKNVASLTKRTRRTTNK